MTALPTQDQGSSWRPTLARALAILGQGLSAGGQPGGWANVGPAIFNAGQAYDLNMQNRRRFDLTEQEAQRAQERFEAEQRDANAKAAARLQQQQLLRDMIGRGPMSPAAPAQIGQGLMARTASAPESRGLAAGLMSPQSERGLMAGADPRRIRGLAEMRQELMRTSPDFAAIPPHARGPIAGSLLDAQPTIPEVHPLLADMTGPQRDAFAMLAETDPDAAIQMLMERSFAKPAEPYSGLAKLKADLDAGRIDRATYDAAVRKENYIAPREGQGLTERQRNARDAGLVPGTREYQQYILGRDDNEGGGPFEGNSMDAQASNILLTGDPASSEYAAAYAHLAQPKVQFDPTTNKLVTVSPDLSWAAKPGQQPAGAGAPQVPMLAPGASGNRLGPTVQNAQALPPEVQSILEDAETFQVPGATVTSRGGTGLSAADRTKLRGIEADAQSIKSALTRFKETVSSSDWRDDLSAYAGGMTEGGRRLNTTYNSAALLSKAESLFNLGVLNGPDLELIRRTIPDPSTLPGMLTSEAASGAAVDEIINLIDNRLNAFRSQFGGGSSKTNTTTAPTMPSGGRRVDQLPPGNWK